MTWTTPAHVSGGLASTAQFNEETVDNLQHLYDGRMQNLYEACSGGPTSGTTELVLATLAIPAQARDVWVVPIFQPHGTFSAVGRFAFRVRDTNTSGTIRAVGDTGVLAASGTQSGPLCRGPAFTLAASTALTLVGTVARISGTGTFTATGSAVFGHLTVEIHGQ